MSVRVPEDCFWDVGNEHTLMTMGSRVAEAVLSRRVAAAKMGMREYLAMIAGLWYGK